MKIKNIAFFGVMASILSVAGANAAATNETIIASKAYVDRSLPTKTSQLQNDSNYATTGQVAAAKSEAISAAATDATTKANAARTNAVADVKTNLENTTTPVYDINAKSLKVNGSPVLTGHQDISGKANTDLGNITTAGNTVIQNQAKSVAAQGTFSASTTYADDTVGAAIKSKQDTITDLSTIRSGASAGATALQKADITTGSANGKISVKGTDVAVKGLGSAAYTASTAYDAAGAAATAKSEAISAAATDATNKANAKVSSATTISADSTTTAPNEKAVSTALASKASADDLTSHTGNTTVHITAAERTAWNAKQNAITSTNKLPAANVSGLATVATSGSYNDLTNKPTIPAAQVQSDWNATTGMGVILNKPTLATVATSGSYTDLSNKPTIPTVDQTYSSTSSNAQSGKAVASAVSTATSGKADKVSITAATGNNLVSYNAQGIVTGGTAAGTLATKNEVTSAEIANGTIVNADVSTSAAIAYTKMAAPTVDINGGTSVTCSSAAPCVLSYDGSAYSWTNFAY